MLLNRFEFALMNNPGRAALQRLVEAPQLARMGGTLDGGVALEVGCGRGVGVETILSVFGAGQVDAFDLDPAMVGRARRRLAPYGRRARLWVGDACAIPVPAARYDAVFDYGIIHHVPDWRMAIAEIARVLKPGGRFYGEEMLAAFITHRVWRRVFRHPQHDRFTSASFAQALEEGGFAEVRVRPIGRSFAWFAATRHGS